MPNARAELPVEARACARSVAVRGGPARARRVGRCHRRGPATRGDAGGDALRPHQPRRRLRGWQRHGVHGARARPRTSSRNSLVVPWSPSSQRHSDCPNAPCHVSSPTRGRSPPGFPSRSRPCGRVASTSRMRASSSTRPPTSTNRCAPSSISNSPATRSPPQRHACDVSPGVFAKRSKPNRSSIGMHAPVPNVASNSNRLATAWRGSTCILRRATRCSSAIASIALPPMPCEPFRAMRPAVPSGVGDAARAPGDVDRRTPDQVRADVARDLLLHGVPPIGEAFHVAAATIRPTVHVTVPVLTLLGLDEAPAELDGYGPIDPDTARALAAQAPSFGPPPHRPDHRCGARRRSHELPPTRRPRAMAPRSRRDLPVPRLRSRCRSQRPRPHRSLGRGGIHRVRQSRPPLLVPPPPQARDVVVRAAPRRRHSRVAFSRRPPAPHRAGGEDAVAHSSHRRSVSRSSVRISTGRSRTAAKREESRIAANCERSRTAAKLRTIERYPDRHRGSDVAAAVLTGPRYRAAPGSRGIPVNRGHRAIA